MWYFSWILGVALAVGVGVLNGLWHEFHSEPDDETGH
ncbi:MAG: cytochrome bd-I oxidase subunit CydX [Sphingobium sp.]